MLVARDSNPPVTGKGRQGLTRTVTIQPGTRSPCEAGHHRALHQALRIDHLVVFPLADMAHRRLWLAQAQHVERPVPPAPQGHRDDLIDRRVPARYLGKGLLDDPVKAHPRTLCGRVTDGRQGMQHIAQ